MSLRCVLKYKKSVKVNYEIIRMLVIPPNTKSLVVPVTGSRYIMFSATIGGISLPRNDWVLLNRFKVGKGGCN